MHETITGFLGLLNSIQPRLKERNTDLITNKHFLLHIAARAATSIDRATCLHIYSLCSFSHTDN